MRRCCRYGVFFNDASTHEGVHKSMGGDIAHFMIRLYGALLATQGWIVWSIRNLNDGKVYGPH